MHSRGDQTVPFENLSYIVRHVSSDSIREKIFEPAFLAAYPALAASVPLQPGIRLFLKSSSSWINAKGVKKAAASNAQTLLRFSSMFY